MAFASFDGSDHDGEPLAEINMVPLIDVMLVLLIIFMVTAPLLTHAVKVDLPKAASAPNVTKPDNVQLAIDASNQIFWNGEAVDAIQFSAHLKAAAVLQPQPELHIRAERTTTYEKVAQVMSEAARQGLVRIGFVTDPSLAGRP
jgi:biopolymer transport protein ExbD